MKAFTRHDLRRLMAVTDTLCISITMPTAPAAAAADAHRIRFKNLLRQAAKTVQARAPKDKSLAARLAEGERLLADDRFWRHQSDGLAVFMAPRVFIHHRLPITFPETFTAGSRFVVKPLLPLFMADGRFHILALSQAQARLFGGSRFGVAEIALVGAPEGIAEALPYDSKQAHLQFHTGTAAGRGKRAAVFHGQGVGIDDRKEEIRRYLRQVDRALADSLRDPEEPLVLVGVDFLLALFREVTAHRRVLPEGVRTNPDTLGADDLHRLALPLAIPELERDQHAAAARYRAGVGLGHTASGVEEAVPAAAAGRVDTLFVALHEHRPGFFEGGRQRVTRTGDDHPGAEDLLDRAVTATIEHGGRVFALPQDRMPDAHAAVAAILRY